MEGKEIKGKNKGRKIYFLLLVRKINLFFYLKSGENKNFTFNLHFDTL